MKNREYHQAYHRWYYHKWKNKDGTGINPYTEDYRIKKEEMKIQKKLEKRRLKNGLSEI